MKHDMTCREAQRLVRFTPDEMRRFEAERLEVHLSSCSACSSLRREFLAFRTATLEAGKTPPVMDFSQIKINIESLSPGPTEKDNSRMVTVGGQRVMRVIRYVSGIAAMSLFVLFLWEQAIAVRKLSALQAHVQSAPAVEDPGLIDRLTIARAALVDAGWADLAGKLPPPGAPVSLNDLEKARKMIQGRIRQMRSTGLISGKGLYHTMAYRNTINFNEILK